MNIRLFKPSVGEDELNEIRKAFERSWIGMGPSLKQFESNWSEYVGAEISLGLNSATAALHLALMAFKFPKGSKVLVPTLTFASSASAIMYNDLIPVFVDIDPVTLQMSVKDLENKCTKDCVAIMMVHYAGHPGEIEEILSFGKQHNLKVVEDCSHTAGGKYKGKNFGLWGDIGCYSFEEKKCMTTGDGGMICSNDIELISPLKAHRWVGIDKDTWKSAKEYTDSNLEAKHWFYEISVLGYKYNMNDLAASIGLVQLKKLDQMNARRSQIIRMYLDGMKNLNLVQPLLPFEPENYVYQMFGLRAEKRDELMIYLKSKGIATGCHYTPLSQQPLFAPFAYNCSVAEKLADTFITLPLHADLTNEEVNYVIEHVNQFENNL